MFKEIDTELKILIAEDEYLVSEEIIRELKGLGYQNFIEVSNGAKTLEMTILHSPDLVLMDIAMPGLDGFSATEKIQKEHPTPVIILTAFESQELVEKASKAGASAYITKPPAPEEIKRAITIAMARHHDLMTLRHLNKKLEMALKEVKKLQGLLPICSYCKEIRDDKGYWHKIESYISSHSEAEFTHSICPKCIKERFFSD